MIVFSWSADASRGSSSMEVVGLNEPLMRDVIGKPRDVHTPFFETNILCS